MRSSNQCQNLLLIPSILCISYFILASTRFPSCTKTPIDEQIQKLYDRVKARDPEQKEFLQVF